MNIVLGFVIALAITAIAVAAMLLVRRSAPDGSYFTDGDRAAGVFGVLASGFAILLGFIVFLAFTTYDQSRAGAENEAVIVAQQIETAQFFNADARAALTSELVCYGRYVAGPEWDRLADGSLGDEINPWGAAMFRTLRSVEPETGSEDAAYGKWLEQTSERQQARQDRLHGANGVIPTPLWIALFSIAAVIFVYMLFFADKSEGRVTQSILMGSVAFVIATLFLLLQFLDNPYRAGVGSLRPVAMERALRVIDQQLDVAGFDARRSRAMHRERRQRKPRIECRPHPDRQRRKEAQRRRDLRDAPLALAAVATAWSSYQANRWNGEAVKAGGLTNALRIQAARTQGLSEAETQVDVATFIEWANAYATDNKELQEFYTARFRDEFRPAFDVWIATDPLENPDAPPTPFKMTEYQPKSRAEAARIDAAAAASGVRVQANLQRSANYVLAVVLFAVSLFFAGISTKLTTKRLRIMLLCGGWIVFLGAVVWLATFPVSLSV